MREIKYWSIFIRENCAGLRMQKVGGYTLDEALKQIELVGSEMIVGVNSLTPEPVQRTVNS